MTTRLKRLTDQELKEIARREFKKKIVDYFYEELARKIEQGKIYTTIVITPGEEDIVVTLYEAGLTDTDPSTVYANVKIHPISGEFLGIEILNLLKK